MRRLATIAETPIQTTTIGGVRDITGYDPSQTYEDGTLQEGLAAGVFTESGYGYDKDQIVFLTKRVGELEARVSALEEKVGA